VPASTAAATLTASYNNLEQVKELFQQNKGEVGLQCGYGCRCRWLQE